MTLTSLVPPVPPVIHTAPIWRDILPLSAQYRPHGGSSMFRILTAALMVIGLSGSAFAQSQAINGTIEGTIVDDQGAVLPGVTVTVTNLDTGDTRVVVSNESGLYRAPLLPLGSYRVNAELQGFRKYEQTGVSLSAGQVAVIDVA